MSSKPPRNLLLYCKDPGVGSPIAFALETRLRVRVVRAASVAEALGRCAKMPDLHFALLVPGQDEVCAPLSRSLESRRVGVVVWAKSDSRESFHGVVVRGDFAGVVDALSLRLARKLERPRPATRGDRRSMGAAA